MTPASDVPPPPGADTPVPADVPKRAPRRRSGPAADDRLIPKTALETRAEQRAREQAQREQALREQALLAQQQLAAQQFAAQQAAAQRAASPYGAGLHSAGPYAPGPYAPGPYAPPQQLPRPGMSGPYAPMPQAQPMQPVQQPMQQQPMPAQPQQVPAQPQLVQTQIAPYGGSQQLAPLQPIYVRQPMAPVALPKRPLTRRQSRATLLSGLVGQTILSIATHFLGVFALFALFSWLIQSGSETPVDDINNGTLADTFAYWTTGDRFVWFMVIGLVITAIIALVGWFANSIWLQSARVRGARKSIVLGWVTTTVITGAIGLVVWPMVMFGGLIAMIFGMGVSFDVSSIWLFVFVTVVIAAVLCGLLGMLFEWVYVLVFRERFDPAVEARIAAAAAEAAARAADEAELSRVG